MTDQDHRIRVRAYHLWEQAGRPDHRDGEFWAQAEQEIRGEGTTPPAPRPKPAAKTPKQKNDASPKESAPKKTSTAAGKPAAEPDAKPKRKTKK